MFKWNFFLTYAPPLPYIYEQRGGRDKAKKIKNKYRIAIDRYDKIRIKRSHGTFLGDPELDGNSFKDKIYLSLKIRFNRIYLIIVA